MKAKLLKKRAFPAKQTGAVLSPLSFADALSIPREISKPFLTLVDVWLDSCGVEHTVSRLKSIKLDFIRRHAGMPMEASWVAHNKAKTRFRGPTQGILTWSLRSDKNFSKALQFLNNYTRFHSTGVTLEQETKFLTSVTAVPEEVPECYIKGVVQAAKMFPDLRLKNPRCILENLIYCPSKREPDPFGRSFPEGERSLLIADQWAMTLNGILKPDAPGYEELYQLVRCVLRGVDVSHHGQSMKEFYKKLIRSEVGEIPYTVGKIGIIQEPGFKLRAVANPARIIQKALKPLGDALFHCLSVCPWDCTYDQAKAFPYIQEALRQNVCVHSVDLTDASSYFPLDLQSPMLRSLFPHNLNHVDAFLCASRSSWFYRGRDGLTTIRWTKGQPLGLYPSFPSAFLAHGLLLLSLNGWKYDNEFFVLGDDVVILDDNLHRDYRIALAGLACPVSEAKCISSPILAEFAGKVITKNLIVSQLKWRNPSDDSFLDSVRNFGSRIVRFLKKRQRHVVSLVRDIPSFMGGLGFNPEGLPLEERVFKALLKERESCNSYLMSYNGQVNQALYSAASLPNAPGFSTSWEDFDQKSVAYVKQHLPGVSPTLYGALGMNLNYVSPDLDLFIDGRGKRRTLLEILEHKYR